nr:hypothetical protein [Nitrosomonas nitrosa]
MIEDPKADEEREKGLPDTDKLRRFSLSVGMALLLYTLAGGQFEDRLQTPLSTAIISIKCPWVLLWAFGFTAVYSAYRYWYYAINLALTRSKIRKRFQQKESIYAFGGSETYFQQESKHSSETTTKNFIFKTAQDAPAGLPVKAFIINTEGAVNEREIQQRIAKQLDSYFPRIRAENIVLIPSEDKTHRLAHIGSIDFKTIFFCWMENAELWLPVIVNAFAVILCLAWPYSIEPIRTLLKSL